MNVFNLGSPPQVRGKHQNRSRADSRDEITPAGAGKTLPTLMLDVAKQDHPRRCGENVFYGFFCSLLKGSPPQVRGKHPCSASAPAQRRITPAGAGKTCPCGSSGRHAVDHPRRCGENRMMMSIVGIKLGSPPQVRGKRAPKSVKKPAFWITPAGAGKTRRLPWRLGF